MNKEEMEVMLAARGYLYQLFQSVFGQRPNVAAASYDAPLLCQAFAVLGAPEQDKAKVRAFAECIQRCQENADALAQADRRYGLLIEGPGSPKANPWESLFLAVEPRMFGEVTLAVRKSYRSFSIEPQMGVGVADDHIALELGFMKELAQAMSSQAADEGAVDASYAKGSADFLDLHLLKWVEKFADSIIRAEEKDVVKDSFHAAAAQALVVFLHNDRKALAALNG